jgi:hypothetical protein
MNRLTGLEGITELGNALVVSGNDAIETLDGLNNLKKVGYAVKIGGDDVFGNPVGNASLRSMEGVCLSY